MSQTSKFYSLTIIILIVFSHLLPSKICAQEKSKTILELEHEIKVEKDQDKIAETHSKLFFLYASFDINKAMENLDSFTQISLKMDSCQKILSRGEGIVVQLYTVGELATSMKWAYKILDLTNECGDSTYLPELYNAMGSNLKRQNDWQGAINMYLKVQEVNGPNKFSNGLAFSLANLSECYRQLEKYDLAIEYAYKADKLFEEHDITYLLYWPKQELAKIYFELNMVDSAEIYFRSAIQIIQQGQKNLSTRFKSNLYLSFGTLLLQTNRSDSALNYLNKGIEIASELNIPLDLELGYQLQIDAFQNLQIKDSILKYQALLISIKDSIYSKGKIIDAKKFQAQYQAKNDSLIVAHTLDLQRIEHQSSLDQARNERYLLYSGLFSLIIFLGLGFKNYQQKKRDNVLIAEEKRNVEKQKEVIEETHKEITDSINYAERIQRSFLASKEILDTHLQDYFVFFKPKEAVSGDFYWAAELLNGNFAWSVADSTGHGVPGAIMSLLNIYSLEKSIETEHSPEKILFKTREIIINRLKKDGSLDGGKDGMDCNLLVINKERDTLTFASAHNPVLIIREGEILEFKGDKIPVGKHDRDTEFFTLQTFHLQKGDVIYALTDGFPDQFGGEKGKKYMIKNLKNKFLEIAELSMCEQKEILSSEFESWKNNNEQVDDVCIIGVRI